MLGKKIVNSYNENFLTFILLVWGHKMFLSFWKKSIMLNMAAFIGKTKDR